ncbi:NAD+ synthase [Thiomicrospira sp. ALE5]|uniref:NAD+ synthase n=1 Tax=Thiomicrospira sp. ALE5 TaxID=748650 RepID=UPI0008E9BD6F|nr:NAD+ synthase [Thiomicrospira sp. ALE5]SFR52011.1 NAD+ synthase (glutamine-hydrolysing) [Thiomicrospira sp. ALE5]
MSHLVIVMAQINPLVGDIVGNEQRIVETIAQAKKQYQADMVVFPELTLIGYPPEDLLLRDGLYLQVNAALMRIAQHTQDCAVILGAPWCNESGQRFNGAILLEGGQLMARYAKQVLPNYSVFDEQRYFSSGTEPCVVPWQGIKVGLVVCEDIWHPEPIAKAQQAGAQLIVALNASPFNADKHEDRLAVVRARIAEAGLPIIYVNQVGGQDELVFDGASFAMSAKGELMCQADAFVSGLYPIKLDCNANHSQPDLGGSQHPFAQIPKDEARVYQALQLGIRDYALKNGFKGVLLGLSGGIDSALTLALAVDALGADRVTAVMMPFHYTAQMSIDDAQEQAQLLGVAFEQIAIAPVYDAYDQLLTPILGDAPADITAENLQARIRGTLLMALSNRYGALVLATSNKSESAVGYSTLYGDMVGGFSPLKDVPKTWVYRLARYRNSLAEVIPERVITRPPSAELRPDQCDQDSLPDYDVLDQIIAAYVEQDLSPSEMLAANLADAATIERVVSMIQHNEYKRRQAAPGIKVSMRAFGRDRRYPITSGYQEKLE